MMDEVGILVYTNALLRDMTRFSSATLALSSAEELPRHATDRIEGVPTFTEFAAFLRKAIPHETTNSDGTVEGRFFWQPPGSLVVRVPGGDVRHMARGVATAGPGTLSPPTFRIGVRLSQGADALHCQLTTQAV